MNLEEIKMTFSSEFREISDKFQIHDIRLIDASHDKTPGAASPGVYVFIIGKRSLKLAATSKTHVNER